MQAKQIKYVTILLTLLLHATRSDSDGNGDEREPRAKKRIVKLYPGVKREPVKCTEEGFQADPFDCTLFYQCVLGKKELFFVFRHQCGPGTIFDPENNICNHPRSTNRKKCSEYLNALPIQNNEIDLVKDELYNNNWNEFAKEEDSSKINDWKSQTTDSYLMLNTELDKTSNIRELPKPLKDDFFSIRQTTSYSQLTANHETAVSTEIPYSTPYSIKTSKRSISHQQRVRSENICISDGFVGDSENCKLFYRCISNGRGGFNRYDYSCSDSTVWDDGIGACNHPWAVTKQRCKGYYKNHFDLISASESFSANINKSEEVFGLKETPLQSQISKNQNEMNVAYNSMNLNSKQNKKLSNNVMIDPTITQLNHSNNEMQNKKYLQMGQSEITQSPMQLYESSLLTTTRQKDPQRNTHPVSDNRICLESGFVGDENDCKKFYRCVDNGKGSFIKYEFTCGDGTVWDQQIEGCNHVWAVKECTSKIPNKNITSSLIHNSSVPNYQSTSESIIFETDEFGNENNHSTLPTSTTGPPMSKPISTTSKPYTNVPICKTDGFLGDASDCKKFYRCVDNGKGGFIKYEYSCGEGTLWDTSIEACNYAWAVKCNLSYLNNLDDVGTTTLHETLTTVTLITTTTTQKSFSNYEYETVNGLSQQNSQSGESSSSNLSTTTITTLNPIQSLNECTSSGFMADKNDCKKFYRCVDNGNSNFIRYEFTCGDGTIWDQNIESCNHEYLSSNCKFNTTHPLQSKPVDISTIQPTTRDPNYSQTEMYTKSTIMTPQSTQSFHEYDEASIIHTSTTPNSDEKTENQTCNSEGFYANSHDCKKFYRCVKDGKGTYFRYDFICGEGTVWDQEIQSCNHDSGDKNCSNINSDIISENAVSNNQSMTSTTHTEYENTTPIVINYNECTAEGFFSYLKDCRKFYRCVNNGNGGYIKYDFICGEGTVWVQEIQACDHDNNAENCSTQSGTENSQTNEQIQESTSSTTFITSTSQRPYEDYSNGSSTSSTPSTKCISEGFYPNENNCIKFYRCVDNGQGGFIAYEFTCGDGTAWDSSIQSCNHISYVQNCQSVSNNSSTEPTKPDQQQQTPETTTKPIIDSSKPTTVVCQDEGYYGNYDDCKKFFRCVDNGNGGYIKYEYNCGEGTIWDQDITACNHPQDVANPSCKFDAIQNTSTQSSSTQSSSTQSSSTQSTPTQSTSTQSTSTQSTSTQSTSTQSTSTQSISSQSPSTQSTPMQSSTSEENSVSQPTSTTSTTSEQNNVENNNTSSCDHTDNQNFTCTKAGYYANPSDCKKFYRCVDWDGNGKRFSIYHYVCGEGTIWDPQLETCNYEESIYPPRKCKGQQTQSQNNTQETTSTSTTERSTYTTTTQRSTTKSTTEKSTTNQPTTVSQPTSEKTTTEQAASTQQTTTETTTTDSTTTEKSTTQQSTTSEPITTEMTTSGSTPVENTTTEQTTSSESTTQSSTTTDESTTQQSSTEKSTTESMTGNSTEDSTTAPQTTTTELSTSQSTTSKEELTTHKSTTEQSTTESTTQESTTQQSTTEGKTEENITTTESTTSETKCPETSDDQSLFVCPTSFKRHPKYCNLFYQCTENDDTHEANIATFRCPNNTIYDENKVQCVEENKANKKCTGKIAKRTKIKRLDLNFNEPITVGRNKHTCSTEGHFPFERDFECSSAFLKCQKTRLGDIKGTVFLCPPGYVYWSISRRCESKRKIIDCKSSSNHWDNRWNIPFETQNIST